jgi:hypothetical protein
MTTSTKTDETQAPAAKAPAKPAARKAAAAPAHPLSTAATRARTRPTGSPANTASALTGLSPCADWPVVAESDLTWCCDTH